MKVQNIYFKPFLKPKYNYGKPCFETAYLSESVKNLLYFLKSSPKCCHFLGYFNFSKNHIKSFKSSTIAHKSPNLVTLPMSHSTFFTNLKIFFSLPIVLSFQLLFDHCGWNKKSMLVERKVHYSVLLTYLVGWDTGALSFPPSDVILAQLACPLSDIMFCLHSGITNLSFYKY